MPPQPYDPTVPLTTARRRFGLVTAIALAGAGLAACFGSSSPKTTTTTTTQPKVALCPLTDTSAPNDVVPARPALVFKIDNYSQGPLPQPYARPQAGLDHADVIFEEQVEGSITRLLAVFQCHEAPLVGDVRSARLLDIGIASELSSPLLVHVGGIQPVLTRIDQSTLVNVDLGNYPQLQINPADRVPPYDDFTTTAAMWHLYRDRRTPPAPIFSFSATPPPGPAVSQIHLDWSITSDIYWRWDAKTGTWLRFYDNNAAYPGPPDIQPDLLLDGAQNQVQNVIIQVVHISFLSWLENFEGGHEVYAPIANSSGRAFVFRNGRMIAGTWTHGPLTDPTIFRSASGKVIPLEPGRTWVEVYPSTDPIQISFVTPVKAAR